MPSESHKLVEILTFPLMCHKMGIWKWYTTNKIKAGLMCIDFCGTIQAHLVKAEDRMSVKNNKN